MTIPDERTRAVLQTAQFLLSVALNRKLPRSVRLRAKLLLRHFPTSFDMALSALKAPDIWAKPK